MSDKMLRNQRAFIFPVVVPDGEFGTFVVGPLQPGETLVSIDFATHANATGASSCNLNLAVHDEPITASNFFTDAVLLTHNGAPIVQAYASFRQLFRVYSIFFNREASDFERYFGVSFENVDLTGDLTGHITFNITLDKSRIK